MASFTDRAKAIYIHAAEKGGMSGVDTEVISKIQLETAKNSPYTAHQIELNHHVDQSVARLHSKAARLDEAQHRSRGLAADDARVFCTDVCCH